MLVWIVGISKIPSIPKISNSPFYPQNTKKKKNTVLPIGYCKYFITRIIGITDRYCIPGELKQF